MQRYNFIPMIKYKVVELSYVTEESIEKAVNEWTERGWTFDQMSFAMRDASKRPSMAFIFFSREEPEESD